MASNTENLDLLMKNPSTDGADTFNIQTMLNENWQKIDANAGTVAQTLANILKPTTPPIIGLPSSATPNDMFNALAHAGDLHVWRKTVVTTQEIPAGYTLGPSAAKTLAKSSENSGNSYATFYISSSISVDDAGNVTMNSPATVDIWQGIDAYDSDERAIFGKFIKFYSVSNSNAGITSDLETGIYFIPNSAEFTRYRDGKRSGYTNISACQKVNPYPLTPAGTTTTYPVSTNRNAYQEGSNAKPAGYTLGEVVTGQFSLGVTVDSSAINRYNYSSAITVNDDGAVSLLNSSPLEINGGNSAQNNDAMAKIVGKYISLERVGDSNHPPDFDVGAVWFIPADSTYGNKGSYPNNINYITKRQPVTGYAAIPANTTIEYLGCLGDKNKVEIVSYVGTGVYGVNNTSSLTFDRLPQLVVFLGSISSSGVWNPMRNTTNTLYSALVSVLPTSFKAGFGFGYTSNRDVYGRRVGNTIEWYNPYSGDNQYNNSGYTYYYIAIY